MSNANFSVKVDCRWVNGGSGVFHDFQLFRYLIRDRVNAS